MEKYKNVYTDISCFPRYVDCLKGMDLLSASKKIYESSGVVRERLMFGTDYVLSLFFVDSLKDYFNNFAGAFSEDQMQRLMYENPAGFMGL